MQYHFKETQFGVTHRELCNYNNYNRRITTHIPGWRKGKGTIYITGKHIIPETFIHIFTDIGNIRASKLPPLKEPKGPL